MNQHRTGIKLVLVRKKNGIFFKLLSDDKEWLWVTLQNVLIFWMNNSRIWVVLFFAAKLDFKVVNYDQEPLLCRQWTSSVLDHGGCWCCLNTEPRTVSTSAPTGALLYFNTLEAVRHISFFQLFLFLLLLSEVAVIVVAWMCTVCSYPQL